MPHHVKPVAERYGRLRPTEYLSGRGWKCECDCGKTVFVQGGNLRRGNVVSCGCFRRDEGRKRGARNVAALKEGNIPWGWAKANAFRYSEERIKGEILVRPALLRTLKKGRPCWVCRRPARAMLCTICSAGGRAKKKAKH